MEPLFMLAIVGAVYLLVYLAARALGIEKLQEKGVDAGTPFFVMIRTKRLNEFLTRMGKKFPRAFFNLGVVVAFGGMIYGFWMFLNNFIAFFTAPSQAGAVVPIIPGVTITGLPLVYMLIGLAITLVTHEFAHGLASAKDDIGIESSGLLFFFVLFGAFVEPDEEQFEEEATPKERMRLLAAGSYSNLIFAFIVLLITLNFPALMSLGFNQPSGAYIYEISANTPADQALEVGDVITGLNDTDIDRWGDISQFMIQTEPGDSLTIETLEDNVTIVLGESQANASKGYIGIYGADYWEPKAGWDLFLNPMVPFHIQLTLTWSFIILFSVALFNLLPIPALDGDKLLANGLRLVISDEEKVKMIMWPLRIFSLAIVILSMILTFMSGKTLF
ncbi:MAG: PDZ domain-containing protein [Candidatus Lokiarchaeota archaeon]|nr:PDZ domain-containing protein [Candidatus Lokiarchaeota archaeon]